MFTKAPEGILFSETIRPTLSRPQLIVIKVLLKYNAA